MTYTIDFYIQHPDNANAFTRISHDAVSVLDAETLLLNSSELRDAWCFALVLYDGLLVERWHWAGLGQNGRLMREEVKTKTVREVMLPVTPRVR